MNREHNFCVVALMELFQKKRLIDSYRRRLNVETAYANINGKIWLFVDTTVEWELVDYTEQQVTVRVFQHDLRQHMMMSFVYAKCSAMERLELWDHLYYIASDMKLPWLVGGDFNVILHEDEKIGGLALHLPEYVDFAFCVNSCGLFEQGYKGSPFTWWNGRSMLTRSDHAPLLITCGEQTTNFVKPFRFLNFWTKHATFMDVVRQNWEANFIGDPFLMFKQKLKRVKAALSKWSRETFGDIFKQLAILEDILQGLEYYVEHDLHPLILEADSLVMKKVIEGEWDPPWVIANNVKKIIVDEGQLQCDLSTSVQRRQLSGRFDS
ncbi:PREDICTED: uncharacterized protein LOC109217316 [Nicotiana attenuata]|uniref:uncharacterized protein LOC109217316 n=1 Tax=Nicotiana attenuata TaxID=49451 RepID=UPI0009055B04|nr:PREDICTED: uncharacterized protein LOC109217316 [Nicotiana attenuata]